MSGGLLQVGFALVVTFGLLGAGVWALKRWGGALTGGAGLGPVAAGVALRVLKRAPLGPRQNVALVQVDTRVLVLSVHEGGAQLLAELEGESRDRALAPAPAPRLRLPGFARLGRRAADTTRAAAVALALGAATVAFAATAPTVAHAAGHALSATGSQVAGQTDAALRAMQVTPPTPPHVAVKLGEGANALELNGAVGLVVFLGAMTLLPTLFLLMTSFTRILIVLNFLRSALGTQNTPPNQLMVALAILLTGVVMHPVLQKSNDAALQPYLQGKLTQVQAYTEGVKPFRQFMEANTRDKDLATFARLARVEKADSVEDLPIVVVVGAFVTSELRVAFQMGFVLFLPFLVVDLIVSSVLMSLGMFMLPPVMVSLPFKLLLFVLADGWTLVVSNLVASFR